jgi:hypothetical protein
MNMLDDLAEELYYSAPHKLTKTQLSIVAGIENHRLQEDLFLAMSGNQGLVYASTAKQEPRKYLSREMD